jgi:hypothetical protein
MSPVMQSKPRDPRSLALAVGGLVLGVGLLLVLFVFAIPRLTESGDIRVNLGPGALSLGNAHVKAEVVADGPLLFPDVAGGQRDIYVQHTGDDPLTGWTAFDARKPGTGRECTLEWDGDARLFRDPCDGSTVPADGGDLPSYKVEVDDEDQLSVQLVTPTTAPPDTMQVTGSAPPRT